MRKMLLAVLIAFMTNAQAGFFSGNKFIAMSETQQLSYVAGLVDTMVMMDEMGKTTLMCGVPKTATVTQLHAISKKYANEHPEQLHNSAPSIITVALITSFPCK